MKNLLFALLLFSFNNSFAQSRTDYEHVMDRIVKCYNEKQFDKMRPSFISDSEFYKNGKWDMDEWHNTWGKIGAYKFVSLYEGRITFITTFLGTETEPESTSLTSFSLDKNNKIFIFGLIGGRCGGGIILTDSTHCGRPVIPQIK